MLVKLRYVLLYCCIQTGVLLLLVTVFIILYVSTVLLAHAAGGCLAPGVVFIAGYFTSWMCDVVALTHR